MLVGRAWPVDRRRGNMGGAIVGFTLVRSA